MGHAAKNLLARLKAAAGSLSDTLSRTIDADQWRTARSWRDRLAAISWPRTVCLLGAGAAAALTAFILVNPPGLRGYPPPLPSKETLTLRDQGLKTFKSAPPAGLIEANRSAPAERHS